MAHKPVREAHPVVFVHTHWLNLLSIFFLTLSGFYIHYPFFAGGMPFMRGTHFFWMFVLIINLAVRIIASFFVHSATQLNSRDVSEKDIKNWLPQKENRHQLWPVVKYYLFMKKEYPISAKYAPLQKIAYLATVVLTLAAAYTGFCLWDPTKDMAFFLAGRDLISQWFDPQLIAGAGYATGGAAIMPVRVVHYFIMWAFIAFTMVHAYLANIYGFAPSKMIFAWIEEPDALESH